MCVQELFLLNSLTEIFQQWTPKSRILFQTTGNIKSFRLTKENIQCMDEIYKQIFKSTSTHILDDLDDKIKVENNEAVLIEIKTYQKTWVYHIFIKKISTIHELKNSWWWNQKILLEYTNLLCYYRCCHLHFLPIRLSLTRDNRCSHFHRLPCGILKTVK